MSALTITKLDSFRNNDFCSNRCIGHLSSNGAKEIGIKSATYSACICDSTDILLCKDCAKAWGQWWEEAGGTVKRFAPKKPKWALRHG